MEEKHRTELDLDDETIREILFTKGDIDYYKKLNFQKFCRMKFNHPLFHGTGETLLRRHFRILWRRLAEQYESFIFEILCSTPMSDLSPDEFRKLRSVLISPDKDDIEKTYLKKECREEIIRILKTLTPKEEKVIRMRFGIDAERDSLLKEIGKELSLSTERVRQIESKALRKLKNPSRIRMLKHLIVNR